MDILFRSKKTMASKSQRGHWANPAKKHQQAGDILFFLVSRCWEIYFILTFKDQNCVHNQCCKGKIILLSFSLQSNKCILFYFILHCHVKQCLCKNCSHSALVFMYACKWMLHILNCPASLLQKEVWAILACFVVVTVCFSLILFIDEHYVLLFNIPFSWQCLNSFIFFALNSIYSIPHQWLIASSLISVYVISLNFSLC